MKVFDIICHYKEEKMKKIYFVFIGIIMSFSLIACGDNATSDNSSGNDSKEQLAHSEDFEYEQWMSAPDGDHEYRVTPFKYIGTSPDVVFPENTTHISSSVFNDCKDLIETVVVNEGVTEIYGGTFENCINLTSVTLPESLEFIQPMAFAGCTNLKTLNLPESVTEIGGLVFDGCTNLTLSVKAGSYAEQYAKDSDIPYITYSDGEIEPVEVKEVVTLTDDNWQDYFEEYRYEDWDFNDFGEPEEMRAQVAVMLKKEYAEGFVYGESDIAFEITEYQDWYMVTVDSEAKTWKRELDSSFAKPGDYTHVIEPYFLQADNVGYYTPGFEMTEAKWRSDWTQSEVSMTSYEVLRVTGTLVYISKE